MRVLDLSVFSLSFIHTLLFIIFIISILTRLELLFCIRSLVELREFLLYIICLSFSNSNLYSLPNLYYL